MLFFLLSVIFIPATTMAADLRSSTTGIVNVSTNEKVKNLYAAGATINADANTAGDSVLAGSTININGNTEANLFAAGGTINARGNVGNNARLAGGTVFMGGQVGQDLLLAAGSAQIGSNAVINGDFLVTGGNIEFNGRTTGNLLASNVDKLIINGQINGNVRAKNIGELVIGSSAVINGNLNYSSVKDAVIESGAVIKGTTNFQKINQNQQDKSQFNNFVTTSAIISLIMGLLTLLIIVYLLPLFSRKLVNYTLSTPWINLFWGLIFLIITPILMLILLITVIGIKLALLLGLLYLVIIMIANLFTPLIVGSLFLNLFNRKNGYRVDWLTVLIGILIVFILQLIPVIGWLVVFVFFLITLGGLVSGSWHYLGNQRENLPPADESRSIRTKPSLPTPSQPRIARGTTTRTPRTRR